jgi:hypothetical protein
MSSDMSRPLSGKPDGTTPHVHVTNTCLPAGQRPNKMPIFISEYSDVRAFLAWLRESCPGGLTAQLKGELMVVPSKADGFRATIRSLRSLDGKEGVGFHTFTLPEDRCVRLLVKNLGRVMLKSVVREELEILDIHVQGVTQLGSVPRDQDPAKDGPPTPTWLQKARCNASASDTCSETADTHPGALRVGAPTFPVGALPHGNSLSAVAAGETTRRTI